MIRLERGLHHQQLRLREERRERVVQGMLHERSHARELLAALLVL